MQSVDEFMRTFLNARVAEEEREQASRAPFRRLFYTDDCHWDSRLYTLDMLKGERIISIQSSVAGASVVTELKAPPLPTVQRFRYHLKTSGNNWLIGGVERQCPVCNGEGDEGCVDCKGKHWMGILEKGRS